MFHTSVDSQQRIGVPAHSRLGVAKGMSSGGRSPSPQTLNEPKSLYHAGRVLKIAVTPFKAENPKSLQGGVEVVNQFRVVEQGLAKNFGLLLGGGPVLFLDRFG